MVCRIIIRKARQPTRFLAAFERDTAEGAVEPHSVPSLARVESEHIQRVLADCGGNISQADRLLGIDRRSLQRKLAKYPVVRSCVWP